MFVIVLLFSPFAFSCSKEPGMKLERIKEIVKTNYRLRDKLGLRPDKEEA